MYKLVTFSGYDSRTGPHLFPIEPDSHSSSMSHIKMARDGRTLPASIDQYIRNARPIPGKSQLLIDAMGSGEYYGSNVNGDYFPESALRNPGPEYGYETFMHYAYPFRHHINKDPARAFGDKVTLSAYDPIMHRVLLIVIIDDSKCSDLLEDITNNSYPDVSMGCRVPWDRCSICNQKAKNRAEYCPHLRYQMNKILPDGRRVFAYNDRPKFFDISFVTIGAEKASHVLKKVAHSGSYELVSSAEAGESMYAKLALAEKKAVEDKLADIDKEVPSNPPASISELSGEDNENLRSFMDNAATVKSLEPSIPNPVLDQMAAHPLKQIAGTLAALGIDLKPHEFQRIVLVKQGAAALADSLERRRLVFDEMADGPMPKWAHELSQASIMDADEKVASIISPYIESRSCYPEVLLKRLERMEKSAELEGYTRGGQWYPMDEEQMRASSGISGLAGASAALAVGFLAFKKIFPNLETTGPGPVKALAKFPWMLPILLGAGVGASVGFAHSTAPMPIVAHGTGRGLDGIGDGKYHHSKHASTGAIAALGAIPLAYIYAGIQQRRWLRGERLNKFDQFVARRPDLSAIGSAIIAPLVAGKAKRLLKHGSVMGDMALYAIGGGQKLMPVTLAGAAADLAIFKVIDRIANRKKKN